MSFRRLLPFVLAVVVLGAIAMPAAATRVQTSLSSKGSGRQGIDGGGLTYGSVARNGTVLVIDLSAAKDASVTIKAPARKAQGGKLYTAKKPGGLAFRVSGTHYRIVLNGISSLNGIGVYGSAFFRGAGFYSLSGGNDVPWTTATQTTIKLGEQHAPPAVQHVPPTSGASS
jgi:hypothetical protein